MTQITARPVVRHDKDFDEKGICTYIRAYTEYLYDIPENYIFHPTFRDGAIVIVKPDDLTTIGYAVPCAYLVDAWANKEIEINEIIKQYAFVKTSESQAP